jgi:hypothetical protein
VQTPWGLDARVLNVSRSGVLIESRSKLAPDSSAQFHLCEAGRPPLVVPARVVRSEVAAADVRGVKYRAAAVFEGRFDILPEEPGRPTPLSATPQALAELLARVTADLAHGQEASAIRTTFEQGLQRLVAALDIKVCDVPVTPIDGNGSIYFKVPDGGVLQVIFEANHEPAAEEFRLLKAAAAVATLFQLYEHKDRATGSTATGCRL